MEHPPLECESDARRAAVCRAHRNGIDSVEVPDAAKFDS